MSAVRPPRVAVATGPPLPPDGSGLVARVIHNSGWLAGAYVTAFALAFVLNAVLARSLQPERYGVLAVVLSLVTFVQLLLGSRVWEATTTFVTEFRARGDAARATATVKLCYLVDALGAVLGFALLQAIAEPAARIFSVEAAAPSIRLFAWSLLLAIPVSTGTALLRLADRYRWLAVHTVGENLVRLVAVGAVILVVGPRLVPVVGAYLVASAVSSAVVVWLAARAGRELVLARWADAPLSLLRADRRRIWSFLAYSNLSGTARLVTGRVDVLIVGWLTDPASTGAYRLARSVSDPLAAFATPVSQAVFPELSRLVQARDATSIRTLTARIRSFASAVVLPVCALTVLLAGWAVPAVFGEAFANAVPMVRIMVWQLVWLPYVWLPGLLLALGRARTVAAMTAVDAAAYLVLLVGLTSAFGAVGAAWATLLRFVAWTALASVVAARVDRGLEPAWA
jgi:O-antigen/teichoic acid export membrane protein